MNYTSLIDRNCFWRFFAGCVAAPPPINGGDTTAAFFVVVSRKFYACYAKLTLLNVLCVFFCVSLSIWNSSFSWILSWTSFNLQAIIMRRNWAIGRRKLSQMKGLLLVIEVIEDLILLWLNVHYLIEDIAFDALHVGLKIIVLIFNVWVNVLVETSPAVLKHIVVLLEISSVLLHDFKILRLIFDVDFPQLELVDEYAEKFLVLRADMFVLDFYLLLDLVHHVVLVLH